VDNSQAYFSNIEKLVKYHQVENAQDMIDRTASIKQYLDGLNIDRRKIAVGFDIVMWYFETFIWILPRKHLFLQRFLTYELRKRL